MDVTRRYVRNIAEYGAERTKVPEAVLLHILDEIRSMRRKDIPKQEKFRLEGEDMREQRELRHYVISHIASAVSKIIPGCTEDTAAAGQAAPRRDSDMQKAGEERDTALTDRTRARQGRSGTPQGHPRDQGQR